MKKALSESRKAVDASVINKIYGDLSSPELTELIDDVLDQVTDKVSKEFDTIVENHGLNEKLVRLESCVAECQSVDANASASSAPPRPVASLLPNVAGLCADIRWCRAQFGRCLQGRLQCALQ